MKFCSKRPNHVCLGKECRGGASCVRESGIEAPYKVEPPQRIETVEEVRADADKTARLTGNVLQLVSDATKSALPPETGQRLRELADACDRGEIGSLVLAAERLDVYETHFPSSLTATCVLIQLLQIRWQQKMVE